jgi:hypothetical protein
MLNVCKQEIAVLQQCLGKIAKSAGLSVTHCITCLAVELSYKQVQSCVAGTILQKLPNLKLAMPFDKVKYSEPDQDVGITELPVTW